MPPTTRPEARYWASWSPKVMPLPLSPGQLPLAVDDVQHRRGAAVEAVVVRGGEVEDAGDADEVLRRLHRAANAGAVGPGLLERLDGQLHRVPRVAAEGVARPELRLEVTRVGHEDRRLRVVVRELLGHQQLAGGEHHVVGGGAGQLDVALVADAMALEHRHLEA